ncbi:type II toxin-antitoxin system MqsR family toxin [Sporosarcina limicola]|uniref:Uncharacterized protein n=1 Tax=Sporosarcina limicola TaxID=34101 RepID=A0A927MKH7_9BACL|nr:type II toxin-antitoxin system MqsR family toxin [Sporosarcina limicola]MBE1553224.1 hypothetical protein [Sporosarcina limicola]
MPTIIDIELFLEQVRKFISLGKIDFLPSSKNKYALSNLGISFDDAFALVIDLTAMNYYRGPNPDHKFPKQQVWEFGLENIFQENEKPMSDLYIKLAIRKRKEPKETDILMMSFHSAERAMRFPYRGNRV